MQMGKLMKENGKGINFMAKEYISMQMEQLMKENGKIIYIMAKE